MTLPGLWFWVATRADWLANDGPRRAALPLGRRPISLEQGMSSVNGSICAETPSSTRNWFQQFIVLSQKELWYGVHGSVPAVHDVGDM
jgi:hypothetical protein